MNRHELMWVLQAVLLAYDNVSLEELTIKYGIEERLAKSGYNLCQYLKKITLEAKNE